MTGDFQLATERVMLKAFLRAFLYNCYDQQTFSGQFHLFNEVELVTPGVAHLGRKMNFKNK